MNPHAFRSALRMARRDALRHKWRSLLVVLLIGFPVFVLGCGDIAYRSWQLDPSERITREIGAADAALKPQGGCGSLTQAPAAWLGDGFSCSGASAGSQSDRLTEARVLASLPPGTRAIQRIESFSALRIQTKAGIKYADLQGFDYADPMAKGMVTQKQGRAPRTAAEVALTTALAKSIGAHVGDALQLVNPARSMTVVGIVQDARYRKIENAYSVPAAVNQSDSAQLSQTWYVDTAASVPWTSVLAFNRASVVVLSRGVYLDPPPKSQVPFYTEHASDRLPTQVVATVSLVAGMALLEVVLLAGPAFAVGARRQRRELALIAAVGGQTRDLRNVVLANGVVLGVIAGVSAAFGAVLAGLIGIPTLGTLVDQIPGHTDIRPLELGGIACVSLFTALLAAVFPALHAARTDVLAALAGRRGAVRTRRHVPVIGGAVTALGALVAIVGVTHSGSGSTVILIGVVLTEIGLIVCTPSLLGLAARLGRLLPLAPRIALRDAGRNRSAATPAVAAVMASMIGAVGILIGVTSAQDQDKRAYVPRLPAHAVFASLLSAPGVSNAVTPQQVQAALEATLPVATSTVVRSADEGRSCVTSSNRKTCRVGGLVLIADSRANSRYLGGEFPPVLVDDGSGVSALFGKAEPAAVAALRAGHAVVPDSSAVRSGGVIQLGFLDPNADPTRNGSIVTTGAPITLPATVISDGFAPAAVIVPPAALAGVVTPNVVGVLATTTRPPTDNELQAARGRMQALLPDSFLDVETGWHNPSRWALYLMVGIASIIALGASAIATSLANTDGREDLVTLGAVGASPRTRRVMSMSRAGVVAGLGCLVGVAAGFVPAYAWTRGDRMALSHDVAKLRFVVPWPPILLALFGIPLMAAALAGLVTRSRLPSERAR